MKILTIGGATEDIFLEYSDTDMQYMHLHTKKQDQSFALLGTGEKIEIKKIYYATGGGALNSAVSFQRLGYDVYSFFKIGTDEPGKRIIRELKKEGVLTKDVAYHRGSSGISIIIPAPAGDNIILAHRGANAHITAREIPYLTINKVHHLYITSLSGTSAQLLLPLCKHAKKQGLSVANNPGKSQLTAGADTLRKALAYIDILILNAQEAQQLMVSLVKTTAIVKKILQETPLKTVANAPELLQAPITIENICFNVQHFFKAALNQGPRIVVVTNGAEGVYVATQKNIYFHPSLPTKITSTVGAGDAFGSCFAASIFQGMSVEQALVRGIINATSVISYLDAQEGLLKKDTLAKKARSLGVKNIQQFALI